MTRKINTIPEIPNYNWIINQMQQDLDYRLTNRNFKTSLGRPLYERINIQMVITHECPYNCSFCLERVNPMEGKQNFSKQLLSLKNVLKEHPNARLTVTGGEPSLYINHIKDIVKCFKENSNNEFIVINTTGFNKEINDVSKINLSVNEFVKPDLSLFEGATYQTVVESNKLTIDYIKETIKDAKEKSNNKINNFSFRFLTSIENQDYNIKVFNDIQNDKSFEVRTFRVGDFFTYLTFDYGGSHSRITIGDMYQQKKNNYKDGYSNIIIHPNGEVNTNWK